MTYSFEEFLTEGTGVWVPVDPPRPLTNHEEQVLRALLSHSFPGATELLRQVPSLRVLFRMPADDPSIKMSPDRDPGMASNIRARVPVEGWGRDSRGREVQVLLHVVAGYVGELELLGTTEHPSGLPVVSSLRIA